MDLRASTEVLVLLLFIFNSLDFANSIACTKDGVVITTQYGEIRGLCQQANSKNVTVFYGVPYAKPPVGDLRWQPPQAMDGWGDVVRNATTAPNWCPQTSQGGHASMHEDCLYLNIYVPGEVDLTQKVPVLVWIHGKSFSSGSANEIPGEILAVETGLIVIAINYRLGVFGYLSFDHDLARGNYGFKDQIFALEWIQTNSIHFGAERDRVTIAGASAGGRSVAHHIISPKSKGLFNRAIIHSAYGQNIGPHSALKVKQVSLDLSDHTKCRNESVEIMLNCLRNVTVSEALMHNGMIEIIRKRKHLFVPVVDGEWLTDLPVIMGNSKLRSTDLLVGVVQDEGSIIEDAYPALFNHTRNVDATDFRNIVIERTADADPIGTLDLSNMIIAEYYPANDNPSSVDFKRAILTSSSEFAKSFTRWWADKISENSGNVYMFLFKHESSFSVRKSGLSRIAHGDDLDYVLGSLTSNASEAEKVLSAHMMTAWANFVKKGEPDFRPSLNIPWPKYTENDPKYMTLSTNMTNDSVSSGMAERGRLFYGEVIIEDTILVAAERLKSTAPPSTTPMSMSDDGEGDRFHLTMDQAENAILGLTIALIFVFVILVIIVVAYCIDVCSRRRRRSSRYETSTKL